MPGPVWSGNSYARPRMGLTVTGGSVNLIEKSNLKRFFVDFLKFSLGVKASSKTSLCFNSAILIWFVRLCSLVLKNWFATNLYLLCFSSAWIFSSKFTRIFIQPNNFSNNSPSSVTKVTFLCPSAELLWVLKFFLLWNWAFLDQNWEQSLVWIFILVWLWNSKDAWS